MFAEERKQKIMDTLLKQKRVTIKELSDSLGVSGTTVRTYLTEMERHRLLVRTHGGAMLMADTLLGEEGISVRQEKNLVAKQHIAAVAATLVGEQETLILDTGTTCLEFARQLIGRSDLTIITNDLQIALELQRASGNTILFLGGLVRNAYYCTVGSEVTRALRKYSVGKAFLSANAVSRAQGATTPHTENAAIKRAMMEVAEKKYLLCDSEKVGKRTLCSFAAIADFDGFVTDTGIDMRTRRIIEEQGVPVLNGV